MHYIPDFGLLLTQEFFFLSLLVQAPVIYVDMQNYNANEWAMGLIFGRYALNKHVVRTESMNIKNGQRFFCWLVTMNNWIFVELSNENVIRNT